MAARRKAPAPKVEPVLQPEPASTIISCGRCGEEYDTDVRQTCSCQEDSRRAAPVDLKVNPAPVIPWRAPSYDKARMQALCWPFIGQHIREATPERAAAEASPVREVRP